MVFSAMIHLLLIIVGKQTAAVKMDGWRAIKTQSVFCVGRLRYPHKTVIIDVLSFLPGTVTMVIHDRVR